MYSWFAIIPLVLRKPPHVDINVPSHFVPNPKEEGFKETTGEPQGQIRDYELTLQDGKRIHVRRFEKFYKAHWDKFSPIIDTAEHLRYDAPHWWVTILALSGASLGYLLSKDRVAGAVLCGLIGAFVGIITLPQEG